MYAQAAIKPNTLLRNGAYGIVMRGVQKCTCAGASLRGRNSAPLCCIKLDTATDPTVGSGHFLVIGNPPYIFARNQSFTDEMKAYYSRTYQVSEYQTNTYTIFMELAYQLLRKGGIFSYAVEAVYTDSNVINDLNSMIITDIQVDPFYLLGILNSRLLSPWFFMKFDKFQRRLFPQFKVNELGAFPIPDATDTQQEEVAQAVEQLMEEMKKESPGIEKVNHLNLVIG